MSDPIISSEAMSAIRDNGGTLAGLIGAAAAAVWGMWKVVPRINSELNGATKANTVQIEMLTTLRQERDAANEKLEKALAQHDALFREWADLRSKIATLLEKIETLQRDLQEAREVIANLRGHVKTASRMIDSAPKPPEVNHDAKD